jgi:hypothetical protein
MFNKIFHKHEWELVATNDSYHTTYTDTGKTKHWEMRFYKCTGCNARRYSDNYNNSYLHTGMQKAKQNWLDTGVVPKNSTHPKNSSEYTSITDVEREQIDPVLAYQKTLEDMQKSLSVVINRDFDMEAKYPKLKEAADEYHRRLDKYRNFDALKETSNDA